MRKATIAKLALTAAVGIGTLSPLAGTAGAETPPYQGGGMVLTTPTTVPDPKPQPPIQGELVLPDPDPQPEPPAPPVVDPDLPLFDPNGHGDPPCAPITCEKVPPAADDPECNPIQASCDLTSSGCTWTHGCEPEPECGPVVAACDLTDTDPEDCPPQQASCDLTDRPEDDPGDEPGEDPDDEEGDEEPGDDDGDRGSLPRTGATIGGLVGAGLGLTGIGAALKRLGRRRR